MTGQDAYRQLVGILRTGARLPPAAIDSVLTAAGRSSRDLLLALHAGPVSGPTIVCERCGAELVVYSSRRAGSVQTQYVKCVECSWRGRRTVSGFSIKRRKHRSTQNTTPPTFDSEAVG